MARGEATAAHQTAKPKWRWLLLLAKGEAEIFGGIGCSFSQHNTICGWFSECVLQILMVT